MSTRGWPRSVSATHGFRSFHTNAALRATISQSLGEISPYASADAIKLRQYQEECIQSIISSVERGEKRLAVSLATGGGKTVIFAQLIDRIRAQNDLATQTLIIAHRHELIEQAVKHCQRAYPQRTIEVEKANSHASGVADITVASIQTLTRGTRLQKFDPKRFKLILVDEAHHIVAETYLQVLEHFGLRYNRSVPADESEGSTSLSPVPQDEARGPSPVLVGLTATASRLDGLSLGSALDRIVYHKNFLDMIEEKWLSPVKFTTVEAFADITKVGLSKLGDYQTGPLSEAFRTHKCLDVTVKTWMNEAAGRKSTLVFCVDIDHVNALEAEFRGSGIDAQSISSQTAALTRRQRLDDFKNQKYPILINCGVFTEGTDIPNIDCVLLARPTQSKNLLLQMMGRGLRLHPHKSDCLVIDMVAAAKLGIVTIPTLFGLDPKELVKDATIEEMRELQKNEETKEDGESEGIANPNTDRHIPKRLDIVRYDSVFDLVNDTSNERHIRAISRRHAWVTLDDRRWLLNDQDSKLLISREDNTKASTAGQHNASSENIFKVLHFRSLKGLSEKMRAPWTRPALVAKDITLEGAIHAADTFAVEKLHAFTINISAPWRQGPASEAQITFLNKFRAADEPLTTKSITKGRAADMITKLTNGARGKFKKLDTQRKRKEDEIQRVMERKKREEVFVGPLTT
ncbi:MAG: hypothetical protein Q9160_002858 [Pyrenula sp. 1 TL-2023]